MGALQIGDSGWVSEPQSRLFLLGYLQVKGHFRILIDFYFRRDSLALEGIEH